jgi:hypothetical protein
VIKMSQAREGGRGNAEKSEKVTAKTDKTCFLTLFLPSSPSSSRDFNNLAPKGFVSCCPDRTLPKPRLYCQKPTRPWLPQRPRPGIQVGSQSPLV